jgi:phosphoribosyl-AMP cyclohydrolase / phosphoribosyl-ATP pyrophosphohydrolase
MPTLDLDALDFAKNGGLVTVVTQDADHGIVLMVAHADRRAVEQTLATGEMHYTSRTRGMWHKGATSGNRQRVVSLARDCDGDAILALVRQLGPACHAGSRSCFGDPALSSCALSALDRVIAGRATQPPRTSSYTQRLLRDPNLRLKKLGEETAELIVACSSADADSAVDEAADVIYHILVALHGAGRTWAAVAETLAGRHRCHAGWASQEIADRG